MPLLGAVRFARPSPLPPQYSLTIAIGLTFWWFVVVVGVPIEVALVPAGCWRICFGIGTAQGGRSWSISKMSRRSCRRPANAFKTLLLLYIYIYTYIVCFLFCFFFFQCFIFCQMLRTTMFRLEFRCASLLISAHWAQRIGILHHIRHADKYDSLWHGRGNMCKRFARKFRAGGARRCAQHMRLQLCTTHAPADVPANVPADVPAGAPANFVGVPQMRPQGFLGPSTLLFVSNP